MKVLGQAGHMFHNDVGRTAVWTFTIENSQMRMWYHSRSHTGVTEPFDMYKVRAPISCPTSSTDFV